MGCVYILHFPNGKKYVGMTVRPFEKRFQSHITCSRNKKYSNPVHFAINKYGPDNVGKEILFESEDAELLFLLEVETISALKLKDITLYNMTAGGDGVIGYKFTDEDRAKISRSLLGNKRTLGKKDSPERIEQKRLIGLNQSKETREKIGRAGLGNKRRLGIPHSEESKEKMSQARKGIKNANAKLDEEKVKIIKNLLLDKTLHSIIANRFGVTTGTISAISTGRIWGWV